MHRGIGNFGLCHWMVLPSARFPGGRQVPVGGLIFQCHIDGHTKADDDSG